MLCPKCGANLPDDAAFCTQCGASVAHAPEQQMPVQNPAQPYSYSGNTYNGNAYNASPEGQKPISSTMYLVFSILVTLFCCLPLGIPAIVFACKIDKLQAAGLYQEAMEAAKKAKMWSIIGAVVGAIMIIAIIILYALGIASVISGNSYYY